MNSMLPPMLGTAKNWMQQLEMDIPLSPSDCDSLRQSYMQACTVGLGLTKLQLKNGVLEMHSVKATDFLIPVQLTLSWTE